MTWGLSKLREAVRDDEFARRKARQQRDLARHSAGLKFAIDDGADPARADTPGVLSKLRHAVGRIAGGADYDDRMQTEMYTWRALEQWETLKRDWNHLVEQADREGVHVIYTDGYDHLHERLRSLSQNMLLDYDIRSGMCAVCQLRLKISHFCRSKISHFEGAVVPPDAVFGGTDLVEL